MDTLEQAKQYLVEFEEYRQKLQRKPDRLNISERSYLTIATAYAMVAQAEAQQRQAAALERIASALYYTNAANQKRPIAIAVAAMAAAQY